MAAIGIHTNLAEVAGKLVQKLNKLKDKEYLLRPVCVDMIDLMTKRIHIDGIASDGSAIGTYNSAYLAYRQKYHQRTKDTKVIVSLTRQLENDWAVVATKNGYGVGFKNKFNLQKARWVEQIKDKNIFSLAGNELTHAKDLLTSLTNNALK